VASCVITSDDPCAISRPCPPIGRQARKTGRVYLAVRHIECATRPVRVAPLGCSCDDADCEPSRVCDGYELCCLAELPDIYKTKVPGCADLFARGTVLPCPPDDPDPWVVLAAIGVPESETQPITQIELAGRRQLYPAWALRAMLDCAAPHLTGAWHAVGGDVYHDNAACTTGNNIEAANVRPGTGGRRRCSDCSALDRA
jgi:hypothetical protein